MHVAALGGSIWYGEARRKEKADAKAATSKDVRDREFDERMKMAEAASTAERQLTQSIIKET